MPIPALTTLVDGDTIYAAPLNTNYSTIRNYVNTYGVFKNEAVTISGAWTFTTSPGFNTPVTVAGTLTVSSGGLVVTAGGLSIGQGGGTIVGDLTVSGTNVVSGAITGASLNTAGALNVTGVSNLTGNVAMAGTLSVTGQATAASFVGIGSGLTGLNAANLSGTLPALNGSALTNLNADNITSGTLDQALLDTALGTRTFTSATTVTLVASGVATLNTATANTLAVGGAFSLGSLQVDQSMIGTTPPAGATRYLQFTDNLGNTYRVTANII